MKIDADVSRCGSGLAMETAPFRCGFCTHEAQTRHGVGGWEGPLTGRGVTSLVFFQMTTHLVSFTNTTPPLFNLPSTHTPFHSPLTQPTRKSPPSHNRAQRAQKLFPFSLPPSPPPSPSLPTSTQGPIHTKPHYYYYYTLPLSPCCHTP